MTGVAHELLSLAQQAAYERDYARAVYLCQQALERDDRLADARALLADCAVWLEIEEHDRLTQELQSEPFASEALKLVHEFLQRYPESTRGLLTRAELREKTEDAREDVNQALQINPDDPIVLYAHARLLMDAGHIEEAKQAISRSIDSSPDISDSFVIRAWLHNELGDARAALADVREALRLDPENGLAFVALSGVCLLMGHFEKVLVYEAKARSLVDVPPRASTTLAEALVRLRRDLEAVPELEECLKLDPEDGYTRLLYAQSLAGLGRASEALDQLNKIAEEQQDNPAWHSMHAEVLLMLNRGEEGLAALNESLRLFVADEGGSFAVYNLSWCYAYRAFLAEKFALRTIDVSGERQRAMELLKEVSEDSSCVRYALSEPAFDPMRAEVLAMLPAESDPI